MSDATPTTVSVSREIAAPAEVVWTMISDVSRMGEWSPGTAGCERLAAEAETTSR